MLVAAVMAAGLGLPSAQNGNSAATNNPPRMQQAPAGSRQDRSMPSPAQPNAPVIAAIRGMGPEPYYVRDGRGLSPAEFGMTQRCHRMRMQNVRSHCVAHYRPRAIA